MLQIATKKNEHKVNDIESKYPKVFEFNGMDYIVVSNISEMKLFIEMAKNCDFSDLEIPKKLEFPLIYSVFCESYEYVDLVNPSEFSEIIQCGKYLESVLATKNKERKI